MAVPARPTSGVPIETAWGQVAHDTAVAQDIQTGLAVTPTASPATGDLSGVVNITFARPFAAPPIVVATAANANYSAATSGVTATTLGLITRRAGQVNGSGTSVYWVAIGPRA